MNHRSQITDQEKTTKANTSGFFGRMIRECRGFTLVETMVAIAIFTIVIVIGIGALLNSNASYRESDNVRKVVDNLNFVMEDMARGLRVGSAYVCGNYFSLSSVDGGFPPVDGAHAVGSETSPSCPDGGGSITFEPALGNPDEFEDNQGFLFMVDSASGLAKIYKTSNGGADWQLTTPDDVWFDPLRSGFIVTGAGEDGEPALVVIRLAGEVIYQDIRTPFAIQTSIAERLLDS